MAADRRSSASGALVAHCERLVAERGFHGVTASQVVRAAGQRNNSAIAYHFGSWERLLDAVWTRHAGPVNQDRLRMLAEARTDGPIDLRTLVSIYVEPLVGELERHRPSYWARFNEQWLAGTTLNVFEPPISTPPEEQHNPRVQDVSVLTLVFEQMRDRLQQLPAADRPRRVALMARFVISALAAWERDEQAGTHRSLRALAAELEELAVVLLQAPAAPA